MKIDFTKHLMNLNGKPLLNDEDKPCTLGFVAIGALSNATEADRSEDGKLKFERFKLAVQISVAEHKKTLIDLKAETITMLKSRIAAMYANAILVGRAWEILDPSKDDDS